ncbi:MAG: hypothetical protein IKO59_05580 [Bacteroidales bacterium]|nr:hypothetical protein [Bacteroidales bacterium]
MRNRGILIIVLLSFSVCLFFFIGNYWVSCKSKTTKIKLKTNSFRYLSDLIVLSGGDTAFIMDSGSSCSFIFRCECKKKPVGVARVKDSNGRVKLLGFYFFKHIGLHFIDIHNMFAPYYDTACEIDSSIIGTLGMDVISGSNWHFCFKDSTVEQYALNTPYPVPKKNLLLVYSKEKSPLTTLNIDGLLCHGLLIDIGCNIDLSLEENVLKKLSAQNFKADSGNGITRSTFSEKAVRNYMFDSININNNFYKKMEISERKFGPSLIGLSFFRRFDHMFWDSGRKRVYLWNDEE